MYSVPKHIILHHLSVIIAALIAAFIFPRGIYTPTQVDIYEADKKKTYCSGSYTDTSGQTQNYLG